MNKPLKDYNIDDKVEYHLHFGDQWEWRDAVVVDKTLVHQRRGKPYTMVLVEVIRTYWDNTKEEWYDKLNQEWAIYDKELKPRA